MCISISIARMSSIAASARLSPAVYLECLQKVNEIRDDAMKCCENRKHLDAYRKLSKTFHYFGKTDESDYPDCSTIMTEIREQMDVIGKLHITDASFAEVTPYDDDPFCRCSRACGMAKKHFCTICHTDETPLTIQRVHNWLERQHTERLERQAALRNLGITKHQEALDL